MTKAFSLQPEEQRMAKGLEEEQRNLLAQLGSISLQKKNIKKRLPQIEDEQRKLVRGVVARVGVDQFNAARIDGNNLILDIPEGMPTPQPIDLAPPPNGHAADQSN